mmetsp:Transcript_46044/g.117609  ORF Transcript_46044/g.117609 Transcript_46044/m.117609 type:complete len:251 (+) Transcript_46044:421-1173(+)
MRAAHQGQPGAQLAAAQGQGQEGHRLRGDQEEPLQQGAGVLQERAHQGRCQRIRCQWHRRRPCGAGLHGNRQGHLHQGPRGGGLQPRLADIPPGRPTQPGQHLLGMPGVRERHQAVPERADEELQQQGRGRAAVPRARVLRQREPAGGQAHAAARHSRRAHRSTAEVQPRARHAAVCGTEAGQEQGPAEADGVGAQGQRGARHRGAQPGAALLPAAEPARDGHHRHRGAQAAEAHRVLQRDRGQGGGAEP